MDEQQVSAYIRARFWRYVICQSADEARDFQWFVIERLEPFLNRAADQWNAANLNRYLQLWDQLWANPIVQCGGHKFPASPGVYVLCERRPGAGQCPGSRTAEEELVQNQDPNRTTQDSPSPTQNPQPAGIPPAPSNPGPIQPHGHCPNYGAYEPLYRVEHYEEKDQQWIRVHVHHANGEVHTHLQNHQVGWYVNEGHRQNWFNSNISAKHWFAVLVEEHMDHFNQAYVSLQFH
jgi:hypothetical protein